MDRKQMLDALAVVQEQLAGVDRADLAARERLRELNQDIAQLLRDDCVERPEPEAVAGALQELALQFEAEHPRPATALHQIADGLASIGI